MGALGRKAWLFAVEARFVGERSKRRLGLFLYSSFELRLAFWGCLQEWHLLGFGFVALFQTHVFFLYFV